MTRLLLSLVLSAVCAWSGCDDGADGGHSPDSGSDTDGDADTDADDSGYAWHTFYGSAGFDSAKSVATDASGNIFIYGKSEESWNGPAGEPPLAPFAESPARHFVLKLGPDGVYLWHTFFGMADSTAYEDGHKISIDGAGAVYLSGWSSSSWDGPSGEAPILPMTGQAAFVIKFDSSGTYQWHTFIEGGGAGTVAVRDDTVIVAGHGPAWVGPEGQVPLRAATWASEVYIVALDADGAYLWHTFIGAPADSTFSQEAYVALGPAGEIHVAGSADVSWQGPSSQAPIHDIVAAEYPGSVFVVKLGSDGTYQWHTFHGDDSSVHPRVIGVSASGAVFLAGIGDAILYGPGGEPPIQASGDLDLPDSFVIALDADGAYRWHTYIRAEDEGCTALAYGVAFDAEGNPVLAGHAECATYEFRNMDNPAEGTYHYEWVSFLTADGSLERRVSFGAHGDDLGSTYGVAGTPEGGFVTVGTHLVEWLGPSGEVPLHEFSGDRDLSVCAFDPL